MASGETREAYVEETPEDRYWNQAVHHGVVTIGARLEKMAYKDMTEKGVYLLALGDETRNGVWFRTPLSKSSCSDIGAKSDMIEALHNYIEVEFKSIDPDRCEELVYGFRHDLTDPKFYLSFSRHNLRYSYDDVLKSMLAADCKEEFCRQLSDQLVFCERCGQRPILYNVIRDEDSMTHHLSGHKRESGIYVEEIKQMLLSKLEAGVSQTRAVGSETKNV